MKFAKVYQFLVFHNKQYHLESTSAFKQVFHQI
jgi:hypothetical protein